MDLTKGVLEVDGIGGSAGICTNCDDLFALKDSSETGSNSFWKSHQELILYIK